MPIPKDRAGQLSPQGQPPVLGMTHHHTICPPTQRVHLSSVLLKKISMGLDGDMFGTGMVAGVSLGPRRAHGHLSCLGKGFLATGQGACAFPPAKINWARLIGLICCAGPTRPSLISRSPFSEHSVEPPHSHGSLLMRDSSNCGGFSAGIWSPGPPAAATAEMWGFRCPGDSWSCSFPSGLPHLPHSKDKRPWTPCTVPGHC